MKIWIVGRGVPTPENKMWGSFELEQARLLARSGHAVTYIALTLSFFSRNDPRGTRDFTQDGVRILASSRLYFPGKLGIHLPGYESRCWGSLFRMAEDADGLPDVIHIHYPSMIGSVRVMEAYRRRGVRICATEHWSRVLTDRLKPHERNRLAWYAQHADCLAAVSELLINAVKKRVRVSVPTRVIPNPVSPLFFEAVAKRGQGPFTFIAVGRLTPLKQFDVIAEQFLKAFGRDAEVRLKIIGSGSERTRLEQISGGDGRVEILGALPQKEVVRQMAQADALVSFSRYETFAVPVAEAWACGIPAIVSDASGIVDYVTAETGIVVPATDAQQLCSAMHRLREERSAYDAGQIREYAEEHFSDRIVREQLLAMYGGI